MSKFHVSTTVNGDTVEYLCDPRETLLDCLRDKLNLTGAKEGCGTGDCGACSVTVDGRLVCSCLMLGVEAEGKQIETVEGIAEGDVLHPLQKNPNPTEEETRYWLAGNLCRCTGYDKIIRAVMETAEELREAS